MDWDRVIERNRAALMRIVAALVAMAGLSGGSRPSLERAVRPTLPRHLHCAVLRLLRPAEAAARRLIVVAARGLAVSLPPRRPRPVKPDPTAGHDALRRLGIGIVLPPSATAPARPVRPVPMAERRPRCHLFQLVDSPRRIGPRRRTVPPHAAPRILSFGDAAPHRLPPPPAPDDPVDATHLGLRLAALASALDDLPAQSLRLARWKSRVCVGEQDEQPRGSGRVRRRSPLRLGRACFSRGRRSRRPVHAVDAVLADLHYFARLALAEDAARNDTS